MYLVLGKKMDLFVCFHAITPQLHCFTETGIILNITEVQMLLKWLFTFEPKSTGGAFHILFYIFIFCFHQWLPWWLRLGESACNKGELDSIPSWRRCPGGGDCNPLQNSCLKNSMDREAQHSTQSIGLQRSGHDGAIFFFFLANTVHITIPGIWVLFM